MGKNSDWIQEDWEHALTKEQLYIREREIEMMNAYWEEWCKDLEQRLPAKITVVVPKEEEINNLKNQ